MPMTRAELQEHKGEPVIYRQFADTIPERGIFGCITKAGWAYVWFNGKDEPEEVEPWCLALAANLWIWNRPPALALARCREHAGGAVTHASTSGRLNG